MTLISVCFWTEFVEEKTENAAQYSQYVQETKPLREELGILLKEELYTK